MPSASPTSRLVRALSDHAAASMANARFIEALDASRGEVTARADVERSLRQIAARISAATDLSAVLQLDRRRSGAADGRRRLPHRPDRPGHPPAARRLRGRQPELEGQLRAGRWRVGVARPGCRRPGRRHRPAVLDGRLRGRPAVPAHARGRPLSRGGRRQVRDGGPARRRDRAVRGAYRCRALGPTPGARTMPACWERSPTRPPSPSGPPA